MAMYKVGLSTLSLLQVTRAMIFSDPEILKQHNVYRCMHDTSLLLYNDDLAAGAQAYAETLTTACGDPFRDATFTEGENVATCATPGATEDECVTGYFATPEWYDQIANYVPGPTGSANPTTASIDGFTQVIWEDSEELGCGMSECTFDDADGTTFFRTYVVCRYSPGGNIEGEYLENVNEVVSATETFCTNYVSARGDPHMVGFQEQKFDFTGEDGEWYALIHDQSTDMDMNMRITQPVADVPEVTYITGLGLSVLGADDKVHTFEIAINDPHNLETECSEGSDGPCLADGALTILVDGKEAGVGEVELGSGVYLSALNIPGECKPFGHQKYWLEKEAKADVSASRRLRAERKLRKALPAGLWIKKDLYRTDPEACDKYVREASAAGTLFDHQSEHASLQITAPSISLRVNIGKAHQKAVRDPTDSFDIPDHEAYRINLAFESLNDISLGAQGVLGETIKLRYDADGNPIMSGPDCLRGEESMYKVAGPLAKGFTLSN